MGWETASDTHLDILNAFHMTLEACQVSILVMVGMPKNNHQAFFFRKT